MSLKLKLKNLRCHACPHCQQIFKSALHLKYHKHRIHNRRRPYVCQHCKLSFQDICELQDHERAHNDKRMICQVCDMLFHTRRSLHAHMRVHIHHEGHHECGYCTASYLSLADARLHVLLVHDDTSVLPPERVRKKFDRSKDSLQDEVFCVKEGIGLKLKIKRKLSADEDHGMVYNSDSGKGNSDIDDEEWKASQLLKGPTFIPRTETSTTQSHKPTGAESGLLVKPKLEIGSGTSWSGSKFQPRLNSSDFLSKTIFPANQQKPPPQKPPQQQATFGQPSTFGSFAPKSASMGLFGQSTSTNTFSNSGFTTNVNGSLFKTPSLFSNPLKSATFGASSNNFSSSLNSQRFTPKFGSQNKGLFSAGFGTSMSNGFLAPKPLGNSQEFQKAASNSPNASNLNGVVKKEAVFGSKEHARSMVLTEEDKINPFEKYAGEDDSDIDPFAAAMELAKKPPPRRDSEISESSYLSESEAVSSDESSEVELENITPPPAVQQTPIPESTISEMEAEFVQPEPILQPKPIEPEMPEFIAPPTPRLPEPEPLKETETISALLDLPPPTPYLPDIPADEPITQPPSPVYVPPSPPPLRKSARTPRRTVASKFIPEELPRVNGDVPHSPPKRIKSPEASPPEQIKAPESPVKKRGPGRPRKNAKKLEPEPTKNHVSEPVTPLVNGDAMPSEITGHIDLETPSMSICIPKSMVDDPSMSRPAPVSNRRSRTQSGSRTPGRTPNRTPGRTPSRTPSRTPLHSYNYEPLTPAIPEIPAEPEPPKKVVAPRKRMAPTKGEMMLREETKKQKVEPKPKPLIGPKSYLIATNQLSEESEEEEQAVFTQDEFLSISAGRTDVMAPRLSGFKENAKFLTYLRQRALDLIIVLFPDLRVGGHFNDTCDDVEGLLDYLIASLNGDDGPSRVIHSRKSRRENLSVLLTRSTKSELKHLRGKICKLLKICFPLLTLDTITKASIDTLPKLMHKIIKENS